MKKTLFVFVIGFSLSTTTAWALGFGGMGAGGIGAGGMGAGRGGGLPAGLSARIVAAAAANPNAVQTVAGAIAANPAAQARMDALMLANPAANDLMLQVQQAGGFTPAP